MVSNNGILDKVIQSQQEKVKANFNPQELVAFLLGDLTDRERRVIKLRYGLDQSDKQTLQSIGKKLGITRERVRQIETGAIKKAKQTENKTDKLSGLTELVEKIIRQHGSIRLEDDLINELLGDSFSRPLDRNCLLFIFHNFLSDKIKPVDVVHTEKAWTIKGENIDHFPFVVQGVKSVLNKYNQPLNIDKIKEEIEQHQFEDNVKQLVNEIEDLNLALESYLNVSKHFKKNLFDKWGLIEWRLVNPKRMRDKVYLVLSKDKKPLHYKKIADRINEEKFDKKVAHPATIHNELILDKRFVLIGRGIYALAEWGYKPGVIAQVVREVLDQAGRPLSRDEITSEVLKRRMVKQGSINLTLMDADIFLKRDDGKYELKN